MKKTVAWILANWKSNLSGVIGLGLCYSLYTHQISIEEFGIISGTLTSIGLLIHNETQTK